MNTQEKLFYGIGFLVLLLGTVLRIGHFVKVGTGTTMVMLGSILLVLAHSRYSRRLVNRVSELEAEVQQLRAEQA